MWERLRDSFAVMLVIRNSSEVDLNINRVQSCVLVTICNKCMLWQIFINAPGPIFLISMQFSRKFGQIIGWRIPPKPSHHPRPHPPNPQREILDPPLVWFALHFKWKFWGTFLNVVSGKFMKRNLQIPPQNCLVVMETLKKSLMRWRRSKKEFNEMEKETSNVCFGDFRMNLRTL